MTYEQLRTTLIQLYKDLEITEEVPEYIISGEKPLDPIYNKIYQVLAKDPTKYKSIVDTIKDNDIIICFDLETRNNISKLYPEDEELTIRLLIDTTSYYKIKYRMNDNGSWEDENCDKSYKLVTHCPDIYFTYKFITICWENPTMNKILRDRNITHIGEGFEVNPELLKFYESRNNSI